MLKIKTVITDFDNTLFDWFQMWYKSSSAMIKKIIEISDIGEEELLAEIRKVHQKFGTSEYSFLIQELEVVRNGMEIKKLLSKYEEAIKVYKYERRKNLKLYPSVRRTLKKLKANGIQLVIYTESRDYYSKKRVKDLKLDGIIDHIFFPKEIINRNINVNKFRSKPQSEYDLVYTQSHHLPEDDKKPNPKTLNDILEILSLDTNEVVFVGDSLMKDISMANDANVKSIWAKYGAAPHPEEYKLLQKVSHWTNEDIEREKQIKKRTDIVPDIILEDNFSEILDYITIENLSHGKSTIQKIRGSG